MRSELIIRSKWASYSWHCEAFSSLPLFQSRSPWKPGLPLFCIPCHISCPLLAPGNNSRSFSLSLDKLSSCTSKQSWLLNDCSPKQINSSRTLKALGWWGREEAASAVELGAGPCWAQPAGDGHSDVLTSPSPKLWGSGCISGTEKVKKKKARHWVIDGILFTAVLTSHKSHGFDVIS